MRRLAGDIARSLLLALPVLALLGWGIHRHRQLSWENALLRAERDQRPAVAPPAPVPQATTPPAAATAANTAPLIHFLKQEVQSAEKALEGLQRERATSTAAHEQRVAELLAEISRLNEEIEQLRQERDQWRRAAQRP